jgi:hypothetical protein
MNEKKQVTLEVISGVEGPCVAIDDYRVAGPKPWGGGSVKHNWQMRIDDLLRAIPGLSYVDPDCAPAGGKGGDA